ncbi:efflux RND transporter periplasmic adaptor subunit [Methylibium sp. Pch-M]|uniref:efflux RND transporter periplasmic adaptor subunit n=1 Tax=Methylibium sp. Pch-M TaxID=2082386 RepID=UPI00101102F3|nr:efflux RND transporter periplasmic adaptor subunit [Methylibium sp. Pch-M]QAZ40579.1 efflux RND transporter periplasmic adaptor subunit [Methylibium sp. Pch-M]
MNIASIGALIGLGLLGACSPGTEPVQEDIRPVHSTVAGASEGSVGATYSGVVHARYESRLGFQASGRVVARLVDVGSEVRRGQPLLRLDPAQETLHLVAAGADVEAARARVAQNRTDLERTEQLLARRFASQAEVDQQRLALDQAEAQLKSALAQHQIKVNQRGYTELLADRAGVISAIDAEAGQVVSAGQPVVTLAAAGEREVVVSVPESRVDELREARALQVSVWAQPGRTYRGTLRELAPDTDSVTRTYSARIAIVDADAALRLGMTASVFAPDVEGRRAIRLPLSAVVHRSDRAEVWVVDPQTARVAPREVRLGSAQGDQVLVAAGLSGGETVVTAGVHMLVAGQAVRMPAAPVAVAQGERKAVQP